MPSNKWKLALWGKAKAAFNLAQKPTPPAKAIETAGRGTGTVKITRPSLNGPRPPGFADRPTQTSAIGHQIRKEPGQAKTLPPKKEMSVEDRQAIARLNEKFQQSAARDRRQDKGR
jgi:hypothetical protein